MLNHELIAHAAELSEPVITVGGQAVFFWASFYQELYPVYEQPDERALRSNDVDYVSKKGNVASIGKALNINPKYNVPFNPPSIAMFALIDRDSARIKEFGGRLFTNPDADYAENIIDIIDRPSGFQHNDNSFFDLAHQREYRRIQTKRGIPLYKILEQLHEHLSDCREEYQLPDMFIDRELPAKAIKLRRQFERLLKMENGEGIDFAHGRAKSRH